MAKKLDKIPELNKIRFDGHAHLYVAYKKEAKWFDWGPRDLGKITKEIMKNNKVDAIGLADFNYKGYNFFMNKEQLENLPDNWGYYQDSRMTVIVNNEGRPIYFPRSEEVGTKQGHVLLLLGKSIESKCLHPFQSVSNTFMELKYNDPSFDCMTLIVSHPYSLWGGMANPNARLRAKENKGTDGLSKEGHLFDAYEWNAAADGNEKTIQRAQEDNKPLVFQSDSCSMGNVGNAHIILDDLNFENGYEFMRSINKKIIHKDFDFVARQNSRISSLMHAGRALVKDLFLLKIGIDYRDQDWNQKIDFS